MGGWALGNLVLGSQLRLLLSSYSTTTTQGEENLDNDFYLKEAPDGTVLLESVPNKGRYIQVTIKDKRSVNIIRNFSITLLVG